MKLINTWGEITNSDTLTMFVVQKNPELAISGNFSILSLIQTLKLKTPKHLPVANLISINSKSYISLNYKNKELTKLDCFGSTPQRGQDKRMYFFNKNKSITLLLDALAQIESNPGYPKDGPRDFWEKF